MAITTYAPREEFTGNGSTDTYSFAFKITALSHLLVKKYDDDGVEVFSVRGTDTTDLDSVTFDAVEGGGQVVLAANLESDYKLVLLLAPDAPTQSSEFNNKQQVNLKFLERAFDFISCQVQRLAYLSSRSVKMNDSMTIAEMAAFDATLPDPADATAGGVLALTVDKDGFRYGVSLDSVAADKAAAAASALAAAASEAAAAASAASVGTSATDAAISAAAALASEQAAAASEAASLDSEVASLAAQQAAEDAQTAAEDAQTAAEAAQQAAEAAQQAAEDAQTAAEAAEDGAEDAQTAAEAAQALAEAAAAAAALYDPVITESGPVTVGSGDQLVLAASMYQTIVVRGDSGDQPLNALPFTTTPSAPREVTILCDSSDGVRVLHNDAAGGYVGEECLLKVYESLTMRFSPAVNRWVKVSRSN